MCSKSEELQNIKFNAYISFHCIWDSLGNLGRNRAALPVSVASFTCFHLEWAEVTATEHINYKHYTCSISPNTILVCLLLGQIPLLSWSPLKVIGALRSLFLYHIQLKGTQFILLISGVQMNFWHSHLSLHGWCNSRFVPLAYFINTIQIFATRSLTEYIK